MYILTGSMHAMPLRRLIVNKRSNHKQQQDHSVKEALPHSKELHSKGVMKITIGAILISESPVAVTTLLFIQKSMTTTINSQTCKNLKFYKKLNPSFLFGTTAPNKKIMFQTWYNLPKSTSILTKRN